MTSNVVQFPSGEVAALLRQLDAPRSPPRGDDILGRIRARAHPSAREQGAATEKADTFIAELEAAVAAMPLRPVSQQPGRLRAHGVGDLAAMPPKRHWLVANILLRKAVTMLVSPGGQGKSLFLLALAMSAASGRAFLGLHLFGAPLRVIVVSAEDDLDEVTLRVRATMSHHKLTDADLGTLSVIGAEDFGAPLMVQRDRNTATFNDDAWQALDSLLSEQQADILILDPLVSVMGGVSVNDNAVMAMMQGRLVRLAARRNMSIVVAHHTAKFREVGTADAAMGAASIVNLARINLAIETISEREAPALGVAPSDARSIFRLTGTKVNRTKQLSDDQFFRKVSVKMPNAEPPVYMNGDEVGVVEAFVPSAAISPFPQLVVDTALDVIQKAQPPLSPRDAPKAIASVMNPIIGRIISEQDAKALIDHLRANGSVRVDDVSVPRPGRGPYKRQGLVAATPSATP